MLSRMSPRIARARLLAGLAATFAMWLAAYLWHHLLLSGFYVEHLFPGNGFADVSVPLLLLGYVILGMSMGYVAPRAAAVSAAATLRRGLRFGWVIGLLAVAPMTLMIYAVGEATWQGIAVDLPWHLLIEQPFGGVVAVAVLERRDAQRSFAGGSGEPDGHDAR